MAGKFSIGTRVCYSCATEWKQRLITMLIIGKVPPPVPWVEVGDYYEIITLDWQFCIIASEQSLYTPEEALAAKLRGGRLEH